VLLLRTSRRRRTSQVRSLAKARAQRGNRLRQLVESEESGLLVTPCCHDALSARLIENAGFQACFISGFTTSAAKLAQPDCGLITYSEMIDQSRAIVENTNIPLIVDADAGYGNVHNVKRTVRGYTRAGLSGILLEDQVTPKSCGHVKNKAVVSRSEAVARIKAAIDARDEFPQDEKVVLIGRTDAKQAESFDEALWRISAFGDLGVDMVFVDALETEEEMKIVCDTAKSYGVKVLANMLEGGKTPTNFTLKELEEIGFKLASYPLSLLGVSINAMQNALSGLHEGAIPEEIPSFSDLKSLLRFDPYFDELDDYSSFSASYLEKEKEKEERKTTQEEDPVGDGDGDGDASTGESEIETTGSSIVLAEVIGSEEEEQRARMEEGGQLKLRVTNQVTSEREIEITLPPGVASDVKGLVSFVDSMLGLNLDQSELSSNPDKDVIIDVVNDGKRIEVWIEDQR
jgi:2-methylisocitrate lyase-like PEP mutase family enzyme